MARLMKSTLDLPHLTFLVAYDKRQVAHSISEQLSVNGFDYLEKIIQLEVDVPTPSPFVLARTLADDLEDIFGKLSQGQTENVRLALWDGARPMFLNKPRDVSRIANAVCFGWEMADKSLDAGDLLFITCLRIQAPNIYQ